MNAAELKAKITSDHERLRGMESQIATLPTHQRKQYDAMILKARQEITQLEIQLAGMASRCPACDAEIPHHFTICFACLREVPAKLWNAFKCAVCMHDAGHTTEATVTRAKAAALAHLKQFGTALKA
jgi:predicted amidophosphoribosyltransferase